MTTGSIGLPEGVRGRALALALTAVVLASVWAAAVDPLVRHYQDQAETLAQRRTLLRRMQAVAAALPDLRRQAEAGKGVGAAAPVLLEGATDATAAATLQERVQALAHEAGTAVSSAEALPSESAGSYQRIGLRVSLSASYPKLVDVLRRIAEASPPMLVDDLRLQRSLALGSRDGMEASLTVIAFRAGTAGVAHEGGCGGTRRPDRAAVRPDRLVRAPGHGGAYPARRPRPSAVTAAPRVNGPVGSTENQRATAVSYGRDASVRVRTAPAPRPAPATSRSTSPTPKSARSWPGCSATCSTSTTPLTRRCAARRPCTPQPP